MYSVEGQERSGGHIAGCRAVHNEEIETSVNEGWELTNVGCQRTDSGWLPQGKAGAPFPLKPPPPSLT